MNKKIAVFIDIDECLLSSSGNVCREYYEANAELARLVREGQLGGASIRFCSNLGMDAVGLLSQFFGVVNSWMIVEGGVAFFNPTTRDFRINPIITEKEKKLFQWLEKKKVPSILKKNACLQRSHGYMVLQVLEKKSGSRVDIRAIQETVRHSLHRLITKKELKVILHSDRSIAIVPAGVSKGTAIKFLAETDELDLPWSIAVGASESDFSLFNRVGRIGCPNNATNACKEFVRSRRGKVSSFLYTRGVLDVINWYLGNRG
jgi:hydroxymethylpyrimidine pyrophosphatase-like HAD family hydrolase